MKHYISKIILTLAIATVFYGKGLSQVLPVDEFDKTYSATSTPILLDVRTPDEFSKGHLVKAQNIDYRNPNFQAQIKELDKTKPVFVYCLAGARSAAAVEILRQNGFNTVYDLKGGYLQWTAKQKPIEAPTTPTQQGFTAADIEKLVSTHKIVVLDFYAKWCGPCIKMMPTIEKLSEELKGKVLFVKVDADQNKALIASYAIDEIPTFLIFKNGKPSMRSIGYQEEKALRELVAE